MAQLICIYRNGSKRVWLVVFNNGVIDFAYTGIGSNEYGQWYFNRGTIDFGYSGTFLQMDGSTP